MTVSVGATPTEVNLNATTPAAPANSVNVAWQAGAQYDDPNFPGYTVRDTSANIAAATTSVLGVVKPDGTTITILADGTISSSGGGGGVTTTGSPVSGNLTKFSGATSITNGDLSGDVTTSGTLAATVVKVNGAAVPTSAKALASNGSNQLIAATLHGNSSAVQLSDGTGTSTHIAVFDASGNLTDGGAAPTGTVTSVTANAPLTSTGGTTPVIDAGSLKNSVVGITIDGGAASPTAGIKGYIQIPFAGTIIGWSVIADAVGSVSVDIDKKASSAPPSSPAIPNTTTDKISASAPVVLSSAQSGAVAAAGVSTWTTAVAQWDVIGFNLTSATTLFRVTIQILIQRS